MMRILKFFLLYFSPQVTNKFMFETSKLAVQEFHDHYHDKVKRVSKAVALGAFALIFAIIGFVYTYFEALRLVDVDGYIHFNATLIGGIALFLASLFLLGAAVKMAKPKVIKLSIIAAPAIVTPLRTNGFQLLMSEFARERQAIVSDWKTSRNAHQN